VPIVHLIVQRLHDRSTCCPASPRSTARSRGPWRRALARADEVEKGEPRGSPPARLPRSRDFH
jgi:hypothetical protein